MVVYFYLFLFADNYLQTAHLHQNQWILGLIIHLCSVAATIFIAVMMFPMLKAQSVRFAIGYLIFRTLEALTFTIMESNGLSVLILSQEFIKSGSADLANFELMGSIVQQSRTHFYEIGVIFFCIASLMFYFSMFKSKILPTYITTWGLTGATLALIMMIMSLFGIELSAMQSIILAAPIALNEIYMSIWLIIFGFRPIKAA